MTIVDVVRFGRPEDATPPGGLAVPVEVTHAGTVAGDGSGDASQVPASPPESRSPGLVRAVGYVRVSTVEQAEEGGGLSAQRQAIVGEVGRRPGWLLVDVVDDAASGKSLKRPGVERVLRLLADGEADALVVAKLDRLSRSVVHFGQLLELAARQGWSLVALDFGIDTATPNGELVANVLMAVAQWERRIIGQRTKDGLAAKKADGTLRGPIGRPRGVPAEVVARMVAWRAEGVRSPAIADRLNGEGVATAHGAPAWSARAVRDVLARAARG